MTYKMIFSLALAAIVVFAGYNTITSIYESQAAQAKEVATFECETKIQMNARFYTGAQAKKDAITQCLQIASNRNK